MMSEEALSKFRTAICELTAHADVLFAERTAIQRKRKALLLSREHAQVLAQANKASRTQLEVRHQK